MKTATRQLTGQFNCYSTLKAGCGNNHAVGKARNILSLMIITAFLMPSLCGCEDEKEERKTDGRIMEAYELRMNGKADKAGELLNDILKEDSTNALASFELARTRQHLFLGSTSFSEEKWKEVLDASEQATMHDPNNKVFAFYHAYTLYFSAYISMMMQKPDAGEKMMQTCDAFQAVLNLEPGCYEAMLYLMDIYAYMPEDMGGDKEKAGQLASELNQQDKVYGAMAYARLLPDTADLVVFWQQVEKENGTDVRVLEELGRAFLLKSDTENGTTYYQETIHADNTKSYLYMNLARYHILSSQQNSGALHEHMQEAEKSVNSYLQANPALVPPLKAHAYGILALIRMISGDEEGKAEYTEKATALDPFHSKGMGNPPATIYCPPEEVEIRYISFFMPF